MLDDLKELLHRQPFEPFRIVTTSGDRYVVENPDDVAVSESRISIFPPTDGEVDFAAVEPDHGVGVGGSRGVSFVLTSY